MFSYLSPSMIFLCSLYFPLVRSLICNNDVYGKPKVDDCEQALLEIPFARQPFSSEQSRYAHLFADPQFQKPPFHQLNNRLRPQAIIQLPKIWKHNSCRIALMSQGVKDRHGVVSPVFTGTWGHVINRSTQLRSCLAFHPARGGWTTIQPTSNTAVATLYMYDGDSTFSIMMNSYMSDGLPIVPISNRDQNFPMTNGVHGNVGLLENGSLSLPSPSLLANMTRTLSSSEYKLLDSI